MSYDTNKKDFYTIEQGRHGYLSKIRIIDDLFSSEEFEQFNQQFPIDDFKDNYRDGSFIGEDNLPQYKNLVHRIHEEANIALGKINYGTVKTVQTSVLIVSDANSALENSRHYDDTNHHPFGFTLSYHWLGAENAGGTSFFGDFKQRTPIINVPFKPNRLVVFPALIPHQGYANLNYPNNSKRVIMTLFSILNDF